eukprot:Skav210978  [mRNA]  locus=scaffold712:78040:86050:- [translate_table: standard]
MVDRVAVQVLFFFESDASDPTSPLVFCGTPKNRGGFLLAGSHAWLHGTLAERFDLQSLDPNRKETWPKVYPKPEYSFVTRKGTAASLTTPLQVRWVTSAKAAAPIKVSLLFVRWGGEYSKWMDEQEANDGDWGKYGSPPSDEYMGHVVQEGIKARQSRGCDGRSGAKRCFPEVHPGLKDEQGMPLFELHHVFVSNSKDAVVMAQQAHMIRAALKAQRRAAFWMLWPAEWEESRLGSVWAGEDGGIHSAYLPAATLVSKGSVKIDAAAAAESALRTLHHIRRMNPHPVEPGDPPAPSLVNQNGIQKGVVKLGWSWENRFVVTFNSQSHLQARLKELMNQPGCLATYCIVGVSRASFSKLSEEKVLSRWEGDVAAWAMAKEKARRLRDGTHATKISQLLLAWLLSAEHQPVPSMRLDFMVKRLGPGKARVIFGEYCEQGACVLGWQGGPPTIWRACLDAALR